MHGFSPVLNDRCYMIIPGHSAIISQHNTCSPIISCIICAFYLLFGASVAWRKLKVLLYRHFFTSINNLVNWITFIGLQNIRCDWEIKLEPLILALVTPHCNMFVFIGIGCAQIWSITSVIMKTQDQKVIIYIYKYLMVLKELYWLY